MTKNMVYTIQRNIETGDVKLHQSTMMSLIVLANNKYGSGIKSPRMVESGVVSFPAVPSENYRYETWLIPPSKLATWIEIYNDWNDSCNPLPFSTYWYEALIDGANRVINAIDPDGLLTGDFLAWFDREHLKADGIDMLKTDVRGELFDE